MPWSPRWERFIRPGGGVFSSPTAVSWGPGRIDVFARGINNTLHYTAYERSWADSVYLSLRGNLVSDFLPVAVSWDTGRLDVFALGRDNVGNTILQHTWRQNAGRWSNWESLGGNLAPNTIPAAVSWDTGRLDVFALGRDNIMQHIWYQGRWRNWEPLGEDDVFGRDLVGNPTAVSWGHGRLDVFALASDFTLRHKWYFGEWDKWRPVRDDQTLGRDFSSTPTAVCWGSGRIDVFAKGGDNAVLRHNWYFGEWNDWEELGANENLGVSLTSPHAVSWGNGKLDVFARDRLNHIIHKSHENGQWGNWVPLGEDVFESGPSAVSWGNGRIDVFAKGRDNSLYSRSFSSPGSYVRIHAKILAEPTSPTIDEMIDSMRQVFAAANIRADIITVENLNLPLLQDVDVGQCRRGQTTDEQNQLFNNRHNVRANDIVVYFVRSTAGGPPLNGCAVHPTGKPGCVIVRGPSPWTLAHELGHILTLNHVESGTCPINLNPPQPGMCLLNSLMTCCGTDMITNPPPDLSATEIRTMNNSNLVYRPS
jgi:hypothetical protein